MRRIVTSGYVALMRLQGAFVLAFAAMFWVGLPGSLADGLYMLVPSLVAMIMTPLAIVMALPRFTPTFLTRPASWLELATLTSVFLVGGMLFVFVIMVGVTSYGIGEPFARTLAVGASTMSLLTSFVLWLAGMGLCVWNITNPYVPPEKTKPPVERTMVPLFQMIKTRDSN